MTTLQRISARAVATTNITLTGTQTVDTVALVAGDEVLLTGQTNPAENGLWTVAVGAWTRSGDFDTSGEMLPGTEFYIREGSPDNAGSAWRLITTGTITVGTTGLAFRRFEWGGGAIDDSSGTERSSNLFRLPQQIYAQGVHSLGFFTQTLTDRGITSNFAIGVATEMLVKGLVLNPISGTSLDVFPGVAYIPYRENVAERSSYGNASYLMEDEPLGLQANKLYYMYVHHSGDETAPEFALSPTAPVSDAPGEFGAPYVKGPYATRDTSRRYIQAVRTTSGSAFYKQSALDMGNAVFVRYIEDANAAPFLVLSGGAATSETTVSCSGVVPINARTAKIRVKTTGAAAVALGNSEDGITLSDTVYLQRVGAGMIGIEIDMPLDASQAFTYRNSAGGASTDIHVLGYYDRR